MKRNINMTKIAGIVAPFLLLLTLSCEKDKLITYEERDQVYFQYADLKKNIEDSTSVCLGYDEIPKADSTIRIKVMIMGKIANIDRPVHFALVDSLSTGKPDEDIELLYDQSYIAAGSIDGWVCVKIKNTPKLADSVMVVTLCTMPNDYFDTDYEQLRYRKEVGSKRANRYRIYFDAKNEMPILWSAMLTKFTVAFGNYSRVKFEFMCETLELKREYFIYDPDTENAKEVYKLRFRPYERTWPMILNRRLNQYELEHGKRLTDEKGNEVKFNGLF